MRLKKNPDFGMIFWQYCVEYVLISEIFPFSVHVDYSASGISLFPLDFPLYIR
jgi:hypothetical protein